MEKICSVCKADFKDDEQVVLDIMDTLTHEKCYKDNAGFIVTSGEFKEIYESYAALLD